MGATSCNEPCNTDSSVCLPERGIPVFGRLLTWNYDQLYYTEQSDQLGNAGHNATAADGLGLSEPKNHVYVPNVRNEGKTPKTKI